MRLPIIIHILVADDARNRVGSLVDLAQSIRTKCAGEHGGCHGCTRKARAAPCAQDVKRHGTVHAYLSSPFLGCMHCLSPLIGRFCMPICLFVVITGVLFIRRLLG